jgi:hypothetical protein
MSDDVFEVSEVKPGEEYSVLLTNASPSIFEDEYRIPYASTTGALRACAEIKQVGGKDFTLFLFNRPTDSVRGMVGSALNQLAGIRDDMDLENIFKRVSAGDDGAKCHPGSGFYVGSGDDVDTAFKEQIRGAKISLNGARAVFDVSGETPKLRVSQFELGRQ